MCGRLLWNIVRWQHFGNFVICRGNYLRAFAIIVPLAVYRARAYLRAEVRAEAARIFVNRVGGEVFDSLVEEPRPSGALYRSP